MKHTRTILQLVFWCPLLLAVLVALGFELNVLPTGLLAESGAQTEFVLTTVMELGTISLIPLALKLFSLRRVKDDLVSRKAAALLAWGVPRLLLLEVPLLVNTLLYYIYMNPAFGYLAIILLLCLPFVYPTAGRCQAEVGDSEPAQEK